MSDNVNLERLFIEACKGSNTTMHVFKVYQHHYYGGDPIEKSYKHMANIIGNIREKYAPTDVNRFADDLSPERDYHFTPDSPYWSKVLQLHISALRLTEISIFGDMFDE